MKIGIISDTHDNARYFEKAVDFFQDQKIGMFVHCGDWVAPFNFLFLKKLKCPIKGVLGNGDSDIFKYQPFVGTVFASLDFEFSPRFIDVIADGKRIAVFHGDDENLNKAVVESQMFDVFCCGHTHVSEIRREKRTLIINPGSIVGVMLTDEPHWQPATVSVYDTRADEAEIFDLDKLK